jgi:hypothetical protein
VKKGAKYKDEGGDLCDNRKIRTDAKRSSVVQIGQLGALCVSPIFKKQIAFILMKSVLS